MGAVLFLAELIQPYYSVLQDEESGLEDKATTSAPEPAVVKGSRLNLPPAMIVDAFRYLSRDDLDGLQLVSRHYRDLVDEHMNHVCLRDFVQVQLYRDTFNLPSKTRATVNQTDDTYQSLSTWNTEEVVDWLLQRLRCSSITFLRIKTFYLTHEFCRRIRERGSSIHVYRLCMQSINASPETLRQCVTDCFAEVRTVCLQCWNEKPYSLSHINDDFIAACTRKGVEGMFMPEDAPRFGRHYDISEDTIMEYLFGKEDAERELSVSHVEVSPGFFKRLVKANKASSNSQMVCLKIRHLPPHNLDTSSYDSHRKQLNDAELWDFRDDIRFQVILYQDGDTNLEMRRWKDPPGHNFFF